jgi:hypothetical protein
MNERYGVKGCVQRLEERKQLNFTTGGLDQTSNHSSFDVEFSPTGQILRKTCYTFGGVACRSERFEYDDAWRLIRTLEFDSSGVEVAASEVVYSQGKCEWTRRNGAGILTGRGVDQYDGEHLILTSTCDAQNRPKTVKTFEYFGNRLAKSDSRYYLPDGAVYERWLTDYDSQARVLRTYGLKADGSPLGDGKYLYEYNDEGRKSKIWTFDEFGEDNIASSVTIYEYVNDILGNWIDRSEFHLWRNDSYKSKVITSRKLTYYP